MQIWMVVEMTESHIENNNENQIERQKVTLKTTMRVELKEEIILLSLSPIQRTLKQMKILLR